MNPDRDSALKETLCEALNFWQGENVAQQILQKANWQPLAGGDCSEVYLLQSDWPVCVKILRQPNTNGAKAGCTFAPLQTEALGLFSMAQALPNMGTIVPKVLALRQSQKNFPKDINKHTTGNNQGTQILLLEYISQNSKRFSQLARERYLAQILYQIHSGRNVSQPWTNFEPKFLQNVLAIGDADWQQVTKRQQMLQTGKYLGFVCDNFIGKTPQPNIYTQTNDSPTLAPATQWPEFFAELRLLPMLQSCRNMGLLATKEVRDGETLCRRLPEILPRLEKASLLHGDLWVGNVLWQGQQPAALIDPSCYYGHWEVDLAMTRLFGGFGANFYREYQVLQPLDGGWQQRCEIYNLYHLLNHLLLFGSSYLAGVRRVLQPFAG